MWNGHFSPLITITPLCCCWIPGPAAKSISHAQCPWMPGSDPSAASIYYHQPTTPESTIPSCTLQLTASLPNRIPSPSRINVPVEPLIFCSISQNSFSQSTTLCIRPTDMAPSLAATLSQIAASPFHFLILLFLCFSGQRAVIPLIFPTYPYTPSPPPPLVKQYFFSRPSRLLAHTQF
ncbi:hypothetical protein BDQ17DRAFT_1342998 [Cyathus striatus]|nr:hypothetical protein BDQ17DRAFT_1342998 [Cyathus striatus]